MNTPLSSIAAKALSIKEFFDLGAFVIPHYQRPYAWTSVEVKNLISDMYESYQRDKNTPYLLGSITTILGNKSANQYEILDGQQRLTTLSLIFKYVFEKLQGNEYKLKADCENIVFQDEQKPRISQKRSSDNLIFRYLLLDEGQQKSHKLVETYSALHDFEEQLNNVNFIKFILDKVVFIWISTHNLKSTYQIFETLNDRSKSLLKIDLVKNRLFRDMKNEQIESACQLWNQIYDQVGLITNGKSADTHLQSIFTTYVEATQGMWIETKDLFFQVKRLLGENSTDKKYPYNFFAKITGSFGLYMDIYRPGDSVSRSSTNLSPQLIRCIKEIKDLKISHAILFSLFYFLDKRKNEQDTVEKIILYLVHFIKRTRILGNIPAAKYGKEFSILAKKIIDLESTTKQLDSGWFLEELKRIDTDNKLVISNKNFIEKLISTDIKNEIAKTILVDIDNSKGDTTGQSLIKTKDLHAEHICPKDSENWSKFFSAEDHGYYLNKLGNYALLPERRNIEISNKSFDDKKLAYKDSRFLETKKLSNEDVWNKEKIQERTKSLAKSIANILSIE